jgi:hypothetical protein
MPAYTSALAHILFVDEMIRLTSTVERLKKIGIPVIVTSTDDINRELVSRLGASR